MDRWRRAHGDGDPDLALDVTYNLQEHLMCALTPEQLQPVQDSTVTVHYYLRTDVDYDCDTHFYQAVLYAPAVGWLAIWRPWEEPPTQEEIDEGFDDAVSTSAWTAPDLATLLAPRGTQPLFPQLTAALDSEAHDRAHLSDYLRAALATVPGRG
jgi:hypothetical protein